MRLLTDPLLRTHAGPLRRRGQAPRFWDWWGVDAVLISHLHHDHADLPSLRMIDRATPVLASAANAAWLRRRGLLGTDTGTDRWSSVREDSDVQVRLTTAVHRARPMPHRPNDAHGHLVRAPGCRVWVTGDTELYDAMSEIPEVLGGPVDVALVPISGWGPRLSEGHLDPAEAAEACRRVGAKVAVPVHWGTLHPPGMRNLPRGWMDRPAHLFAEALGELAPGCRLLSMKPGESIVV